MGRAKHYSRLQRASERLRGGILSWRLGGASGVPARSPGRRAGDRACARHSCRGGSADPASGVRLGFPRWSVHRSAPAGAEPSRRSLVSTPDVVLLGGDYVSLHERHLPVMLDQIVKLRPPLGVFAVLGNPRSLCRRCRGLRVLAAHRRPGAGESQRPPRRVRTRMRCSSAASTNRTTASRMPNAHVRLGAGVADPAHAFPERIGRAVAGHRFALALCGHTHGGQIALAPGGVPIFLPPGAGPRAHARGVITLPGSGTPMIVSRGIGDERGADPDQCAVGGSPVHDHAGRTARLVITSAPPLTAAACAAPRSPG